MNIIKSIFTKPCSPIYKLLGSRSRRAVCGNGKITEEPDDYHPGGLHPVSLGDTFNFNQYEILRKLGYGQYSTVWLARDSKYQRYVALKILRADCYGGPHDIFEREMLLKIAEKNCHQGHHHVSSLLDHFNHAGPNGDHVCLVFNVLGHHLGHQIIKYEGLRLPVKSVKVITRQLLLGLDFLHRKCGIIHTDLKPTNILLELENPSQVISQYLGKVPPRTGPMRGGIGPLREVLTTPLIPDMAKPHVRIIDFGVASWRGNHLTDVIQSPALRAPEVIIGAPWDAGVDIWSLGCLTLEFVQGIVPFSCQASKKGTWTVEDDHLARITEIIGPFPPQFIEKGSRASHFFDKQGNLIRIPNLSPTSLERLVNGTAMPFSKPSDMPNADVPIFVDFLRGMLAIDPETRKSASELLQHEWINRGAE
ncbi:kinase-like protein [Aspergillus campestris IBT 28561]|uniref:non-specific serine/threonine protein kinase n=1 Tax=Aspergillus campestris (strain IBT 28561) TaxID=1392248 RepID=A0A2I1D0F2_ASPC2|nr:kinase-like protein [Aspergillus campestris IBT 28561]PKY03351.1 kinase-like protein [Aspergillus campestris IBT 28561]